jgi:hypothetical protein
MRASLHEIEALRSQILTGLHLEEENFQRLIEGSDITMEELCRKAIHNWYLTPEESVQRGLVAGIWNAGPENPLPIS